MTDPRGLGFVVTTRVDAYHYVDTVTKRSRKGFILYTDRALVYWMSKKKTSCESSSFGSELFAMEKCCE